jgi:hypothetical protein
MEEGEEMDSRKGVVVHLTTSVTEVLEVLDFGIELGICRTRNSCVKTHYKVRNQVKDLGWHAEERRKRSRWR